MGRNWARVFLLLPLYFTCIHSHGRLMDPPARNSMWRFGFGTPINYSDNEVFCGGVGQQFKKNKGKCGVCGDDWSAKRPRLNENGGTWGTGTIGKTYFQGQQMEVEVELTTNHWGWFEFKLCPVNAKTKLATKKCMDKHPLYLVNNPKETKFYIPPDSKKKDIFRYKVQLPSDVVCSQCVVQWTYRAGNTWALCGNGTGAIGCGDQETFRNCADIRIMSHFGHPPNVQLNRPAPNAVFTRDSNNPFGRAQLVIRSQVCIPVPAQKNITGMGQWCQENCLKYPPNCDPNLCECLDECEAIGELAGVEGTDVFCHRQCMVYPYDNCPEDKCRCTTFAPKTVKLYGIRQAGKNIF
jgi:hypothetical protein